MKFLLPVAVALASISDHSVTAYSYNYQTNDVNQDPPQSPLILLPPQPSQPFRTLGSFRPSFQQQRAFQQIPFQQQFRQIPFQSAQQQFRVPQPFRVPPPQPSPAFQFQPIGTQPQTQPIRSQPQFRILPSPSSGLFHCNHESNPLIDASRDGRGYHFSWCHDKGLSYSWDEAVNYCNSLVFENSVFRPVSINDQGENEFIKSIIASNPIMYIWTSGNLHHTYGWVWGDGSYLTFTDWSHTGGSNVPQPDNREGNENCLAVLKNFYQDGIKWHDIACHHTKPVICEVVYV